MRTTSTLDLAVRLRLAITRTSRRLRQEAGRGLSPSLTSALATVDSHGPLTPSELAARERVQRPTATRLVARLEELGVLQRAADPAGPPLLAALRDARGARADRGAARPQDRLPGPPARGLDPEERATLDRAAAILERLLRGRSRVSAGVRRTFPSLTVPNYRRYFTGQVISISGNWMQIVAEMWLIVQLTGSGVSVGLTAALQFLPMLLFGAWGGLLADRVPKLRCSSTRRR